MQNAASLINYNKDTGEFTWKERQNSAWWNSRYAGKAALTATARNGYKVGSINDKTCYAHRVAWEFVYGPIPEGKDIDHVNGNKSDNRIENLRVASRSQNMANCVSRKGSTSKYIGVSWSTREKRWVAQITKDYKTYGIGTFESEIDAATAYDTRAIEIHGEYARLNFPKASNEVQQREVDTALRVGSEMRAERGEQERQAMERQNGGVE